ncbi:enoyl-CoA hydratase/isomerase family protein [Hydrogenophaga palleronii]|uniref:enoyl-CoA hydratase/isomerase family protein n=1 Tax=Hydrogenophaga palleronii TaxID=65655 RepID=UPI000825F7F8|nr:enoyl-CoA hydratase-related protein [Hydrogenophaga palleronii]
MPTATEIRPATGITLHTEGAVATLVLDLAQPKNSFRASDVQRLGALLEEALAASARCVVIQGAGAVFSAGWDIGSINPAADDPMAMIADVVGPFCRRLRELPVPTISAVTGPALGFGFGLALCCDLCFAEEGALFGSPFRHIGMVPDSGTHHVLLSRLGFPLAAELIYTGRLLSGTDAARLGLINRAVPRDALASEVAKAAQAIGTGPTQALRLSKEILLQGGDFDAMFAHEGRQLSQVFSTADLKEGISAFQQRRQAVFQGC